MNAAGVRSSLDECGGGGDLFDTDASRWPIRAFESLHDLFYRRRLSVDMQVHGFLLGYEKTAGIQAAKNRRKKRLRSFRDSERVGLQHHRSLRASVFRRPASGGFSFC